MTSDMQGLERAARLSLGNFEEPTEAKSRNLTPLPVLLVIAGAMALIVALILLMG